MLEANTKCENLVRSPIAESIKNALDANVDGKTFTTP
jgi:hypothetical protein